MGSVVWGLHLRWKSPNSLQHHGRSLPSTWGFVWYFGFLKSGTVVFLVPGTLVFLVPGTLVFFQDLGVPLAASID